MGRAENAVRRALELHPGSLRALAREAGLSHRLLVLIRGGERRATPATVEALAGALERMAGAQAEAARVLRDSLRAREEDQ